MKELYPEIEIPEFELDLPEIDIPELEIDIPELDLGDLELIGDYSLSIGDSGQSEQPESSLPPSRERS